MFFRSTLIAGLLLLGLNAEGVAACDTLRSHPFTVTDRTTNVVIVVGHVDTRKEAPVSFSAHLPIDANIHADLMASRAAGCKQNITQNAYGSNWAWNSAAGGYRVDVTFSALRPSKGRTRVLYTETDESSVGPFPGGGEAAEQPMHVHTMGVTKSMLKQVAVGDIVQLASSGLVWGEAYEVGVFHQSYGSYGFGAVFEMPMLNIYLP